MGEKRIFFFNHFLLYLKPYLCYNKTQAPGVILLVFSHNKKYARLITHLLYYKVGVYYFIMKNILVYN